MTATSRLPWLLFLLVAVGCAAPSKKTIVGPGRGQATVDEAAVNAIYAEIAAAATAADAALEQLRVGDPEAAAVQLAAARERLTTASGRCVATVGCEVERVLAAQDALIERQALALTGRPDHGAEPKEGEGLEALAGERASPVIDAMPQAGRTVSLLKGRDLRSVIQLNPAVRAALEEWLTWMRPNLLEAWDNYQFMRHKMWPAYEQAGLPEALLFGILAKESGGKVHAVSRAGASGPLQFMYYTGLRYGLTHEDGFDRRFDPEAATRANVAYLNDQFKVLNDNLELVLGAYNGGEGRMQRLSPRGQRGFWDPAVQTRLPPETREYVPMVLAAAWLFLHPEEYNLDLPVLDARPGSIELAASISLNELAVCLGQQGNPRGWFRTLRNLNPRWDPNRRLPAGTRLELPQVAAEAYARSCVDGPLVAVARDLHEAQAPLFSGGTRVAATSGGRTHVVRRGETLSAIARKFGCGSVRELAAANRIRPPKYAIRAGQRLVVPACGA